MGKRKIVESRMTSTREYKFDRLMVEAARRARQAQGKITTAIGAGGKSYVFQRD